MIAGDDASVVSLYFHIPFCKRKCDYCHFYSIPDQPRFVNQLMQGLQHHLDRYTPKLVGKKICSIYFGGGTPSLLGANNIGTILSWLRDAGIAVLPEAEITLEANPEGITSDLIRAYAAVGINRVSMGVQAFDDELLKAISRRHTAREAVEAIHTTLGGGIQNISIDLMYDLPRQSTQQWESTLRTALELPITHLSLYNLVIEPHTAFYKHRAAVQKELPEEKASLAMYKKTLELFGNAGWEQYEVSAFQRGGNYSRHNIGYWTGRPFLGLGPSAFSYWEGQRFRNIANLSKYSRALLEGETPVDFEEQLTVEAKQRELLAINLRILEGVDLESFQQRHGDLDVATLSTIAHLTDQGLLQRIQGRLSLTERGIFLHDSIATEII